MPRAAGASIGLPSFEGAIPDRWKVTDRTKLSVIAFSPGQFGNGLIKVTDTSNPAGTNLDETLNAALESYDRDRVKPTRGEGRVVDGVKGWVIEGKSDNRALVYEFGTIHRGRAVAFSFEYYKAPKNPNGRHRGGAGQRPVEVADARGI